MSFKEALRTRDLVVTAELPLNPVSTGQSLLADANLLAGVVDGFLVTDYRYGQPHMSPLAAAMILKSAGFDPILQLNCRDRNRIALLGEMLGAKAIGIENLMLLRGRILPKEYQPYPTSVVDMEVKELIATAKLVNEDSQDGAQQGLLIGTSATAHEPTPDWHPAELTGKADSGAQFVITQVCLDVAVLRNYMRFLAAKALLRRLSLIVSVTVIESADAANWIRENRPRTLIPEAVFDRVNDGALSKDECVAYFGGIFRDIAAIPGVSGINIAAIGDLAIIPEILEYAGITNR